LDIMVKAAVNSGQLRAAAAPEEADAFFIVVPTAFKENHPADIVAWLVCHKPFLQMPLDADKTEIDFCGVRGAGGAG
jgi:hypothetical protein